MAYLEELLPEFRKGAKIKRKDWHEYAYIALEKKVICYNSVFHSDVDISADDWVLYQEPIDWDYIIKNKCLCWFWDDDDNELTFYYTLEEIKDFDSDGLIYKSTRGTVWQNCRPVRRDEVTFYEDREDE